MKIQIVDHAGNLVYAPRLNRHLEADVAAALEARHAATPRWRIMRRRAHQLAADVFAELSLELRESTVRL